MPALQYRHNAIKISESRLGASLTGSAAACLEIGHQIKHANDFRKSAVCIQSGLDQLAGGFYGIRSAFQDMEQTWSHPTGQKLWIANATNTVKHAQHVAQDVANALRDIVRQCNIWDVVVPDHFYYQLQALEICLQRQELVLNLLGMVLYVASPCELPTYPYYKVRKSLEEMEREKLKYGCEQLVCAVRMRREMQAKLLKIASIDSEYKDINVVEVWEKIPDTDGWPSPQTTMGNTTPTEDWSILLHKDDTASGPMDCSSLSIPGAHPTKLVKRQQRKDTGDPILEEMLDNFGDGNKLEASYPIGVGNNLSNIFVPTSTVTSIPTLRGVLVDWFTSICRALSTHKLIMPSELIKKYRQTVPKCYNRLYNGVIGSAQACSRISDELLETGMQRQTACMQPALGLLQAEFLAMHYALRDLSFIVGTPEWHDNAATTVKCVQRVCHQVGNQLRDIIQASQIWHVVTPDHINNKIHALVITVQEQQMALELLIAVMAFVDPRINAPPVLRQYRIYHHEPKRFDNFLDGVLEGAQAKRAMRQDILELRSSSQQHEDRVLARSSEELPDADTWSSSQSTVTLGAMTPTGDWSNVNCDMATSADRASEDLLETIDTKFSEASVAKLVFHWTNVEEFGRFGRRDLNKEGFVCSAPLGLSNIMPEILQNTSQDVRDLELLDSVTGCVAACAKISRNLDTLSRTTAVCLSGPLSLIISKFNSMSQSYTNVKSLLQRREAIATEIAVILEKHGEWDVLAANGSYHRLNMLSKNLEVLKAHHDLLFRIPSLVSVLLRKPAEHESPASIIIPTFSEEWTFQFTAVQWADYEALQERQRIAYAAAQEMDRWSRDYANSFGIVQENLQSMKEHSKELLDYQMSRGSFQAQGLLLPALEERLDVEDDTSTQSTMDIMTPTIDWSDSDSDTTEVCRAPAITRHSLQRCGYVTASFLRLMEQIGSSYNCRSINTPVDNGSLERSRKAFSKLAVDLAHILKVPMPSPGPHTSAPFDKNEVLVPDYFSCLRRTTAFLTLNNEIEQSFGHLPASTPVDLNDIQAIQKARDDLVIDFIQRLNTPCQDDCWNTNLLPFTVPAPARAPKAPEPVTLKEQKEQVHVDKALEAIIDSMESNPTEKDIMKLVFHWTTLNECNGFKRTDVMKLD
ncbi:hypothetical protein KCU61_g6955, partial [Aureobasidium melanogenum]